ncbi:adenylate/guanylate cyclase domain-containing protein [Seonamhaeicola marinus]|uniref:Adenylate/guanylate cyclase domain-containing protein n=1 Tax=Seonamhaeicola marinus TaxID=1912246 RepID=A0A5D0HKW3_9FLAO|nr:adenylate/guanylate cyclase domain-containing protein [Seonamhaeicola marinus]TYA69942.1 adenylate/guanylate cyclase domain-containing protein [Seonamhaeicola marinus]
MSLSAKTKYSIKRILPFGLIWLLLAWLIMWSEHIAIGNTTNTPSPSIALTPEILVFSSFSVFLLGCLVGILEVFYVNKLFTKFSFPKKLVSKLVLYVILMSFVILVLFWIAASIELKTPLFSEKAWHKYQTYFFSIHHLSTWIQLFFSLSVSLLYAEISDHIGQNVLLNFFTGKYHKPVTEDRVFMFVDMKDSTTIAESLENEHYFRLLRAFYDSFSNAIINNHGEIYQYVGDEIVITWKLKNGIHKNHCLHCFYDMKASLKKRSAYFEKNYGIVPDFKASLHSGKVTTGEIGALKKDIFFTGDVLNTCARILSLCAQYKADLLVSRTLIKELNTKNAFKVIALGDVNLKGKKENVEIVSIERL